MKKMILAAAIAVMVAASAAAQTQGERSGARPSAKATQSVSLSVWGLHYGYEHPLARRATIVGRVGADAGVAWGYNMFYGSNSFVMVAPSIDIEPRFYYGLDRRARRGRSTNGNAGSFVALQIKNILPMGYISDDALTIVGATSLTPMWGLRRVWGSGWLFEFTAGASLALGWDGDVEGAPYANVRFGYSF